MSKVVSITTFVSDAVGCEQAARRLDPVDLRHADVHEDHVRLQAKRLGHSLDTVRSLAGDLDVLFGVEDHAKARAHERLVVDDEDAEGHDVRGSFARRRYPPPVCGPASISPP